MIILSTWSTVQGARTLIKVVSVCAYNTGSSGVQIRKPVRLPLTPSTPHGTHISLHTHSCTQRKSA